MTITLAWGWRQVIMLALMLTGVVINCSNHKKPKENEYNGYTLAVAFLSTTGLPWWGGFF